jgi:hypothetical protein
MQTGEAVEVQREAGPAQGLDSLRVGDHPLHFDGLSFRSSFAQERRRSVPAFRSLSDLGASNAAPQLTMRWTGSGRVHTAANGGSGMTATSGNAGIAPRRLQRARSGLAAYIVAVVPRTGAHGPYGLFLLGVAGAVIPGFIPASK